MNAILEFAAAFFLSTFFSYWMHRLAHVHKPWNPLWINHKPHHQIKYDEHTPVMVYDWREFIFWFGTWKQTLDVWITDTIPTILAACIIGGAGWYILAFHYFYHVFLSGGLLEHNVKIKGPITRILACGQFHMQHHRKFDRNFGFVIGLWDYVFRTYDLGYMQQGKARPVHAEPLWQSGTNRLWQRLGICHPSAYLDV
ncbi:MAG: sterol desaturase family protein [Alphaproteobacteria bacterium]